MTLRNILNTLSGLLFKFDHPAPAKALSDYAAVLIDPDNSLTADDAQGLWALLGGWGRLNDIVLTTPSGPDIEANNEYHHLLSELSSNLEDIIIAARQHRDSAQQKA